MSIDKKDKQELFIDTSASMGAALVGGMVGLTGGPGGVVAGVLVGAAAEVLFRKAGNEIKQRILSKSEENKILTVYDLAKEKIEKRLKAGDSIRNDGFFESVETVRSDADEVFEDLLFAAQREAEEKKLPYMANLFSNIIFNNSISKTEAHQLIKVAESLSYRQLVIMHVISLFYTAKVMGIENSPFGSPRKKIYGTINGYENISILTETLDLYRRSVIHSGSVIFDVGSINPSELFLVGVGVQLYTLMELNNHAFDELASAISRVLSIES